MERQRELTEIVDNRGENNCYIFYELVLSVEGFGMIGERKIAEVYLSRTVKEKINFKSNETL